ncbi:hypothetical protein KJ652_06955 [Patescibacteria group bacterium]|nr:hypothetical protein [Patescibacteria group bacterium]MBU1124288.1 hypothetical protein [Patescibacteria group bacterium]MBU1911534.1 hypothetical protein [Patescibacteria group bacterium]
MPKYDFKCRQCSNEFEDELPFEYKELPSCPQCSGEVEKLIAPPTVHFKGGGFYNTDNRKKSDEKLTEETKEKKEEKEAKEIKEVKDAKGTSKTVE